MNSKNAFTLIELLVVIAIIALQLAIIIPSLGAGREQALEAVCLSNQKQLTLAWTSYYNDNKGLLVGGSNYYSGAKATPYRWVEVPLLNDTDNPETTAPATMAQYSIITRKNGIRAGKLYPYTRNESLYHCPADQNFTKPEPISVYRSYSIAGLMNGEDFISRVSGIYSPILTYRSAITSPGGTLKTLYVATKFSDVTTPGSKYVFVEEDVAVKFQQINVGSFILLPNSQFTWWDWPAYFHNDSSTLGFADGHAELHHWVDPDTIKLMKGAIPADPDPLHNVDLIWLVNGYLSATSGE